MKRFVALLLSLCAALSLFGGCSGINLTPSKSGEDNDAGQTELASEWIEEHIEADSLFSFEYNGASFADFIGGWDKKVDRGADIDENKTITLTYTQKEDKVAVWADITLFADCPAVEWVVHFKNEGEASSPVISDIQALDTYYEHKKGAQATLTYAKGSNSAADDFMPIVAPLAADAAEPVEFSALYGRSSSGYMPYFDIAAQGGGVIAAIGWTGQWTCRINAAQDRVNMTAGMSETSISLYAGEDMRAPSITLLFFEGDTAHGHNLFRRMILDHYTPADENGEKVTQLPLFVNFWGSAGESAILSSLKGLDNQNIPYEGVWIDAGWYGNTPSADTYDVAWAMQVGSWGHIESIYPEGMKNISQALTSQGKDFLLWFEPERAMRETTFIKEHLDYFLYGSASSFYLFDLSNDEATDFLIEFMDGKIKEYGLTWYRQDFNCDPLSRWQSADKTEENRVGMTEIKYITNLYRYLDALLARNPGLMIDNCASGGRRLDIEMTKRSVPLWMSDYPVSGKASTADGVRSIVMNLSYWLPLSSGGCGTDGQDETYEFRSQMSTGMMIGSSWGRASWISGMIEEYYRCRGMMTGDYYMLASPEDNETENSAYMYYVPDKAQGFMMVFRPSKSAVDSQTFILKGLDENAGYELELADTGEKLTASGKALLVNGLSLSLATPRSSLLIYITKVE